MLASMWEKRKPYTVSGNVNWNSHCRKQCGDSSKKLTTVLLILYSPSIPPLSMYPEKIKTPIPKVTCTPTFTAALFTTAKTQKQPNCPSIDEQVKKMWYISHNGILLSNKKEWNPAFAATMTDPENILLSEMSYREIQILYHWYMKSKN